ncbi:hypothetical protein AB0J79_08750 [Rhodococcus coprophilus]|uniref:hypothetical protein n=1 Tax=Rhodococcus coprophilus TaxID=38310 RepID=UPI003422C80B
MREWWKGLTVQQKSGGVLALATVGLTIALGFIATNGNALPALLAVLAVVGQFASAWLFSQHRKADPAHAKTVVRLLGDLVRKSSVAVRQVETVQEKRNPRATAEELRYALTQLNIRLSEIQNSGVLIIQSWQDFDPQTVAEVGSESTNDQTDDTTDDGGTP